MIKREPLYSTYLILNRRRTNPLTKSAVPSIDDIEISKVEVDDNEK